MFHAVHRAYCVVEAAVLSLWHIAWGTVLILLGWWIANVNWSSWFYAGIGSWLMVWGAAKIFRALPGITPGPANGGPGVRIARRSDLRRAGILKD
jgi:hypothetical protein